MKIKGVQIRLDEAQEQVVQGHIDELEGRLAAIQAELATAKNSLGSAEKAQAVSDAKAVEFEKRATAAEAAVAVVEQAQLVEQVKAVDASVKTDGLSADELKAAVVAKAFPGVRCDGKSADYVQGLFEAAITASKASPKKAGNADLMSKLTREDEKAPSASDARAKMIETRRNMALAQSGGK